MSLRSPHPSGRVRLARAGRAGSCAVAALLLASCTSDPTSSDPPTPGDTPTSTPSTAPTLEVDSRVTRVAGRLPESRRVQVAEAVGRLVTDYLEAAYLGGTAADAFDAFTPRARRTAAREAGLLTARGLGEGAEVSVADAAAYVSVLAPRARLLGATARVEVDLEVEDGDGLRQVPLRGRLMLTPTEDGWRIFGYDLSRGEGRTVQGDVS